MTTGQTVGIGVGIAVALGGGAAIASGIAGLQAGPLDADKGAFQMSIVGGVVAVLVGGLAVYSFARRG